MARRRVGASGVAVNSDTTPPQENPQDAEPLRIDLGLAGQERQRREGVGQRVSGTDLGLANAPRPDALAAHMSISKVAIPASMQRRGMKLTAAIDAVGGRGRNQHGEAGAPSVGVDSLPAMLSGGSASLANAA